MDLMQDFNSALLGTDAYGDLILDNGDLALVDGIDAITQAAAQNLKTLQGEVFLNLQLGVPYFQNLFGQKGSLSPFETALQSAILNTPGVTAISYWQIQSYPSQRLVDIKFRATTQLGPISWKGVVSP